MRRSQPGFAALLSVTVIIALLPQSARAGGDHAAPAADWSSLVQRQVAAEEYQVSWQGRTGLADVDAAWQAPNRAHGFRTYFTDAGIRLIPREEGEPSWGWGLELTGYGRGSRVWAVPAATPYPEENRIDYERNGIVEWYVNDPRGLEQGFTLWAPPGETGPDGTEPTVMVAPSGPSAATSDSLQPDRAAYLELALTGTLRPSSGGDGQTIDFSTGHGINVLRYAGLKVTDAEGRILVSWMELPATPGVRKVRLVFEDDGALYPLTVDPLATGFSWIADGDQSRARFGHSLGSAGNIDNDSSGYADLVIGAPWYDGGQVDAGRVYVYLGSESGLTLEPAWTSDGDQAGARLGYSVGTAGDVNGDGYADVIVGAPGYDIDANDNIEVDAGRVYVYHGSSSGLGNDADWTAEGDQAYANFGHAVGSAGFVDSDSYADVVIGAPLYDVDLPDEVRAYALAEDAGAAFVYYGSDSGLSAGAHWTAEGDQAYAHFGQAVGTAGDVNSDGYADLLVGAPLYDDAEIDEGRAWLYLGSDSGLSAGADWTAVGGQAYANFGGSLGTAGDVNGDEYDDLIIGAFRYGSSEGGEGRAFVYHGSDLGPSTEADWTAESGQAWAYFGAAVATAGDVDGDGFSEIVVGAYGYDGVGTDVGRVYLYQGSTAGLSTFPVWFENGFQSGSKFGEAVASAGDVNADGYMDVAVGMPSYYNVGPESGRALVYHGADPVPTRTLYAVLGNALPIEVEEGVFEPVDIDEDVFTFHGTETEEVTVTLESMSAEGRASLYLMDFMGAAVDLLEIDRTDLPNSITAVLPASGEYLIAVIEQSEVLILPGLPFTGDYSLTLDSDRGASGSLAPTVSVLQEDETATEPATAEDGIDRVASPVRQPRIGVKQRPLSR